MIPAATSTAAVRRARRRALAALGAAALIGTTACGAEDPTEGAERSGAQAEASAEASAAAPSPEVSGGGSSSVGGASSGSSGSVESEGGGGMGLADCDPQACLVRHWKVWVPFHVI